MVIFKTEPQAPLTTILKDQLQYYKEYNKDNFYVIRILFVEVDTAIKWAYVKVTSQIIDGDMPYIYNERIKITIKYDVLRITNTCIIYNILRPLLIADELLDKYNQDAILISAEELKKYLTGKEFKVRGLNFGTYKNAMPYQSKE